MAIKDAVSSDVLGWTLELPAGDGVIEHSESGDDSAPDSCVSLVDSAWLLTPFLDLAVGGFFRHCCSERISSTSTNCRVLFNMSSTAGVEDLDSSTGETRVSNRDFGGTFFKETQQSDKVVVYS